MTTTDILVTLGFATDTHTAAQMILDHKITLNGVPVLDDVDHPLAEVVGEWRAVGRHITLALHTPAPKREIVQITAATVAASPGCDAYTELYALCTDGHVFYMANPSQSKQWERLPAMPQT